MVIFIYTNKVEVLERNRKRLQAASQQRDLKTHSEGYNL